MPDLINPYFKYFINGLTQKQSLDSVSPQTRERLFMYTNTVTDFNFSTTLTIKCFVTINLV